jgi:GH24 family phage-related lysozyme (muramidase)
MRQINEAGLDLIKHFEGLRLQACTDAVGLVTIGYGHEIKVGESIPSTITEEEATAFLLWDTALAARAVDRLVTVPISDNQFDALVSFVFNVGSVRFASSDLLKKLNARDYAGTAGEFLKWGHAGGHVLPRLTRRRQAERELFEKPDDEQTILQVGESSTESCETRT